MHMLLTVSFSFVIVILYKQNWKFSSASSSNSTSETRWLFTQKYFRCTTSSSVSNYLYNSSVESINKKVF